MAHNGTKYLETVRQEKADTASVVDKNSYTEDRLRGDAPKNGFKWIDRFNEEHTVHVTAAKPQITVMFPVSNGEVRFRAKGINGINSPSDELKTGCGVEHRWCEATFILQASGPLPGQGEHVWAKCSFYEDKNITSKSSDWDRCDRAISTAKGATSVARSVAI